MTLVWAQDLTPWDGESQLNAVIQIGSRILIAGSSLDCLPGGATIYASDDGGTTWVAKASPFDVLGDCSASVTAFAYSASLDRIVAIGNDNAGTNNICYSDDHGDTWTGAGTLGSDAPNCIARDDGAGLFVIGTSTATNAIYTSTNGISWTGRTTPWDGGVFTSVLGVCFAGGTISKWVAVGCDDSGKSAMTAPDATSTWTIVTSGPFDGLAPVSFPIQGGQSVASDGAVIVAGGFDQGAGSVPLVSVSTDAATWAPKTTALDGATSYAKAVAIGPSLILVGGNNGVVESTDGGASWGTDASFPITPSSASYTGCNGLSIGATVAFAVGVNDTTTVTAAGAPLPTPPPPGPAGRFSNGTRARIVVTDLTSATTTWLDRHLLEAQILAQLNLPWQITGSVRSGDPAVNQIFAADSDPLVAQSNRFVYVFLRDGPANQPWQCRASGVLMSPQDEADADIGTTHFTAYDPWQYLFGRPCFADGAGTPIGPNGRFFPATDGAVIAATLLADTITSEGVGCFIDAGLTYAGTSHWSGTIESTPVLDFTVQQGMTLGDAWNALVAAGDPAGGTGGMDIVLEPIYDMQFRPGYLSQLSIYNLAGQDAPGSPMAWGKFVRTATTANRVHDGTPGNFVNVADFHIGQGGVAVPVGGPPPSNAASVAKYQPYWQTQFFPAQNQSSAVAAMETLALILQKQGKRTFTVNPDPIRAAAPLRDYTIGDRIPTLAPDRLRVEASGSQRIEGIPVVIGPDGVTRVNQLLTTPDWRH